MFAEVQNLEKGPPSSTSSSSSSKAATTTTTTSKNENPVVPVLGTATKLKGKGQKEGVEVAAGVYYLWEDKGECSAPRCPRRELVIFEGGGHNYIWLLNWVAYSGVIKQFLPASRQMAKCKQVEVCHQVHQLSDQKEEAKNDGRDGIWGKEIDTSGGWWQPDKQPARDDKQQKRQSGQCSLM